MNERYVVEREDTASTLYALGYSWRIRDTESDAIVQHHTRALDAHGFAQLLNLGAPKVTA